jgi:hypothetical protein
MKPRLNRDEQGFSKIPENFSRKSSFVGRNPSDLIQTEIEHPMMNLQSFKPAVDEFVRYGPSSDIGKFKNLAAEIAAMNSQLDPSQISTEIDNSMGIGASQHFYVPSRDNNGASGTSGTIPGFSINSFSSLVDFGELDATNGRRDQSWQQSINELMPASGDAHKYHKEYRVYESNDKKRLTSKDWTIDYSMNSQTFTPCHEASSELTNNVVTYVQLNDMNQDYQIPSASRLRGHMTAPLNYASEEKRQMSIDIKTASIGIDTEGRLGSYELITTNLQMLPSPDDSGTNPWDPDPLPEPDDAYRFEQMRHEDNGYRRPNDAPFDHRYINSPPYHGFGGAMKPNQNQSYHMEHHETTNQQQRMQTSHPMEMHNLDPMVTRDSHPVEHPPTAAPAIPNNGHELIIPSRPQRVTTGGVILPAQIADSDVLLERGGKGNHHKGSRYYRRLINERRESYQELPDASRAEKMAISLSVVMSVKATGARFIHKKQGQYVIMSDREARNKISQALREKKERVMLDEEG